MLNGSPRRLGDLIEEDVFSARVVVSGSLTYETQIGGETTVAEFDVETINRIGNNG